MQTLPSLVTPHGEFRLPLADATAERLADALLCTEAVRRRELFRAAVAGDPALAVWALVQAQQQGDIDLTTCESLAGWLESRPAEFFLPNDSGSSEESAFAEFAEPAGCSLAVAELAELFARHVGADYQHAYCLGLVHLGSAWLAESVVGDEPPRRTGAALPPWLMTAVEQLLLPTTDPLSVNHCVVQAKDLVCSEVIDEWRAMGCDARTWIGRWAVLGEAWGRSGNWGRRLVAIIQKLTTLERLQADFLRALETAKLEAMKELAYGAGHEINNPLANISARRKRSCRMKPTWNADAHWPRSTRKPSVPTR